MSSWRDDDKSVTPFDPILDKVLSFLLIVISLYLLGVIVSAGLSP